MTKRKMLIGSVALLSVLSAPSLVAGDNVEALRQQLEQQQALIKAQQQQLQQQGDRLERMNSKIDNLAAGQPAPQTEVSSASLKVAPLVLPRDNVGDLNRSAVSSGDFPGAFKIPGSKDVSLAIGGFIKAVAISDSDAEAMGSTFTPSSLATKRDDKDGAFNIDSALTRMFIDARAPARKGSLRGYLEWDFNEFNDGTLDLKARHAYGTWTNSHGTLVVGHTWSTMMDLKIIPEGLTEPTVSGVIFNRQPQIRWEQPLSSSVTFRAGIEDPSSSDVFDGSGNQELSNTSMPDIILGGDYDSGKDWHIGLRGIFRNIEVELPNNSNDTEQAWGASITGRVNLFERDRWVFSGVYGEGLGRYFLGIQSTSGSAIDPVNNKLELRDNWGGMTSYLHTWSDSLRSTAMYGYAKSKALDWQPQTDFENTQYASANLMWQVLPYLTLGVEYAFGQAENIDGTDVDNHRFAFGVQIY